MLALPALALLLALAPEPADVRLELTLSADKPSYASGESISLQLTIRNGGGRALTLVHPDFWGVSELSVTDAGNRPVKSTRFKGERKAVAKVMTLAPGEAKTHRYTDLTGWTCCYGYTFNPLPPGRYQITVTIKNPPVDVKPPAEWKPFWTGTVSARSLTITVR